MSKDKQRVIGDLETLVNHVLEKARARAEAILARARKEAADIEKRAAEEAKAREEAIVNAGLKDVEKEKRRILAQAELELRGQRQLRPFGLAGFVQQDSFHDHSGILEVGSLHEGNAVGRKRNLDSLDHAGKVCVLGFEKRVVRILGGELHLALCLG